MGETSVLKKFSVAKTEKIQIVNFLKTWRFSFMLQNTKTEGNKGTQIKGPLMPIRVKSLFVAETSLWKVVRVTM